MATLHLEVGVARSVEQTLKNTHNNIETLIQQADKAVQQLRSGAWQGKSAQEFYARFDEWKNQCQRCLTELQNLTADFSKEITQWEEAARSLP